MDLPMVLACLLPEVLFSLTQTSGLANLAHTMEMITISFSPCFLFQIKGEICLVLVCHPSSIRSNTALMGKEKSYSTRKPFDHNQYIVVWACNASWLMPYVPAAAAAPIGSYKTRRIVQLGSSHCVFTCLLTQLESVYQQRYLVLQSCSFHRI